MGVSSMYAGKLWLRNAKTSATLGVCCALTCAGGIAAAATCTENDETLGIIKDSLDLEHYTSQVCKDAFLYQKYLPKGFEREIYKTIIELAVEAFNDSTRDLNGDTEFLQHMIQFDMSSINQMAMIHHELHTPKDKLACIVDKILEDQDVNCSWLPDNIERELYLNVLCVILTVLYDCVHTIRFTTMGQSYKRIPIENGGNSRPIYASKHRTADSVLDHEKIQDEVEILLEKSENSHFPAAVMSRVHSSAVKLTLMLIESTLELTELKMLGSRITMHLQNIDQQAAHLELVRLQHKDRQCAYGPFVCCP